MSEGKMLARKDGAVGRMIFDNPEKRSIKRIAEVVGIAAAKDICSSGRHYDAREAKAIGLVHRVTPPGALEDEVRLYASTLAANAPLTVAAMKRAFIELAKDPIERDLDACQGAVDHCFASEDYVEDRKAFMEKRAPVFKGR